MPLLDQPSHIPAQATLPLSLLQADPLYRTCSPNCSALVYGSNSTYLGVVPSTSVLVCVLQHNTPPTACLRTIAMFPQVRVLHLHVHLASSISATVPCVSCINHPQEVIQVYESSPVLCQAQCAFNAYRQTKQITPQLSTGPDFALTSIPSVCQDAIFPTAGNGSCSPACRQLLSVVCWLIDPGGSVHMCRAQVDDPTCRGRLVNVPTFGIGAQMYGVLQWLHGVLISLQSQWPCVQCVLHSLCGQSFTCQPDAAEQQRRAAPGMHMNLHALSTSTSPDRH